MKPPVAAQVSAAENHGRAGGPPIGRRPSPPPPAGQCHAAAALRLFPVAALGWEPPYQRAAGDLRCEVQYARICMWPVPGRLTAGVRSVNSTRVPLPAMYGYARQTPPWITVPLDHEENIAVHFCFQEGRVSNAAQWMLGSVTWPGASTF